MTLGIHLGGKVTVLLILNVSVLGKQSHGLYRECEHAAQTLLVEPLHETLLQP